MSESLHILKFGGSSLGSSERLARVLEIVAARRAQGPTQVVVSALGDTTDWLLDAIAAAASRDLARATDLVDHIAALAVRSPVEALAAHGRAAPDLTGIASAVLAPLRGLLQGIAEVEECGPATRDRVLSFGELLSASVIAATLRATGLAAAAVDARTWATTDDRHGDAGVLWDPTREKIERHAPAWLGTIAVHTGFIGATLSGRTTTLGRNGSDYTAALLARGLGAAALVIWTDVSGVMTADPRLVDEAYPVPKLSYREALELSGLGLRMLHPRTVLPLMEARIPMWIRDTLHPEHPGTLVDVRGAADERRPTCVASLEGMTLVDVEGTQRSASVNVAPRVIEALAAARVPVCFAAHAPHGNGLALVVNGADAGRARAVVTEELAPEIARGDLAVPQFHAPVSLVTLVAEAMGRTVNVAGRFFGAIGAIGVNVRAASQGATSRAISCVVEAADTTVAVRAVHAAFNLAREQVNVLLLGKGTVGGHLLDQIAAERANLRERYDLDLRLAGVVDRRASLFEPAGLDPRVAREALTRSTEPSVIVSLLDRLKHLPVPVLVDCTAAEGMEAIYAEAFARGIHVVTANKKPLASPTSVREALFDAARRAHRALRYETTVGASLPVIETLKNLVRTGDRVRRIEGCFSGTLGYLANEVTRGEPLSRALLAARSLGYTEPHPRDDLSGTDVARKALILARELGLRLDLADVEVDAFVPSVLFAHDDVDAFLAATARNDDAFEASVAALRAQGRVLRYLATIAERPGGSAAVRVAPVGVAADHPAARLRGTEALVAFETERYRQYPLVVQGAGAGGAVTAAGVLADVLALSQSLRGR